jgi:RND family efflux transporter MFP subunit
MNEKAFRTSLVAMIILGSIVSLFVYKNLSRRPALSLQKAKKEDIGEVLLVSGKVRPINSTELSFEDGGRVTYLAHKEGERVRPGDVLAKANDSESRLLYVQAVNIEKSAEAVLEENKELKDKEEQKLKSLKKSDTANRGDKEAQKEQIEASEQTVESQKYQVEAAKAYAASVSARIDKKIIKAPFAGVIARQDVKIGEVYSTGTAMITLIDDSQFKIEAYVSQTDAARIKVGDTGEATFDNNGDNSYSLKVSEIATVETKMNDVSSYKVTFVFEGNPADLKSGIDANIRVKIQKKSDALILPQSAVFRENDDAFVYMPAGILKKKQKVKTGIISDDQEVEIVSGLKKGDEVYVPD